MDYCNKCDIAYEEKNCPLCDANNKISDLESAISDLESEIKKLTNQ